MNDNYQNYTNGELDTNLIDMAFYLMRHWRSLLLAVLVGSLLGCGIYALKKPATEVIKESAREYTPEENELRNMEMALEYRQLYECQLAYQKNSVLMQLNPDNIYEGTLSYYLSAGNDTEYIKFLYQRIINSPDLFQKMKEVAGLQCEDKYIKELISCSVNSGDGFSMSGEVDDFLENINYVTKNVTLSYKIVFDDSSVCSRMLEVLREEVEKLHSECSENYNGYVLKEIESNVLQSVRSDVLNAQKNCVDVLGVYQSNITRIEDAFSEDAKAYYGIEYLQKGFDEVEKVEESVDKDVQSDFSIKEIIKWCVVGIILLCGCWGVIWILLYIFDKRIKTSDGLEEVYFLPVIGKMKDANTSTRGIDGWISRWQDRRDSISNDVEYIVYAISSLGKNKVVFCGNATSSSASKLIDVLQENHMEVWEESFVHQNKEALERAKNADGVIFFITLNETTYDDVQRELAVCRMQNIPILGTIVLG